MQYIALDLYWLCIEVDLKLNTMCTPPTSSQLINSTLKLPTVKTQYTASTAFLFHSSKGVGSVDTLMQSAVCSCCTQEPFATR